MATFQAFTTGTPFNGAAVQTAQKPTATIPGSSTAPSKPLRRMTKRRKFLDEQNATTAAEFLSELPGREESLHMVIGNPAFPAWSFTPAVLRLIDPAPIAHLRITTLGSNRGNSEQLFDFLDSGKIKRVTFVASAYWRDASNSIWGHLADGLKARGMPHVSCRNHSKLQLFEIDDERRFVLETSANLRSCKNAEVAVLTESKPLHDFYSRWVDSLIGIGDQK